MSDGPRETHAPAPPRRVETESTLVTEWEDGRRRRVDDELIGEEPLEIRVNGAPVSVTMRTPGADAELAAGFLFTEGVITAREQIAAIEVSSHTTGSDSNDSRRTNLIAHLTDANVTDANAADGEARGSVVSITLADGFPFDAERLRRHFYATSSCGVCGKASLDAVRLRGLQAPSRGFRISGDRLCQLPDALRSSQALFGRTGALHAAATFDVDGRLIALREDVGRHNAVDKIIGHALLAGALPLAQRVLLVSGRGGFELVQKALVAGVPVMASVSAPSSLSVRLARELGLTLVGFLRGRRFVIYAGEDRVS